MVATGVRFLLKYPQCTLLALREIFKGSSEATAAAAAKRRINFIADCLF
jgi:hypothetical protein